MNIKKKHYISTGIILISAILLYLYNIHQKNIIKHSKYAYVYFPNGKKIHCEVAADRNSKILGLMFRKHLDRDKGMLFVFDTEEEQSFWMKNTYIPLDIIFISKKYRINKIFKNLKPYRKDMKTEDIPVVSSEAKYVLEINAGLSDENGLNPGDKIKIKFF